MKKVLEPKKYTQINTDEAIYLFQNLSDYDVEIIVSDTAPGNEEKGDFIIKKGNGISSDNIVGILWGKPSGKIAGLAGIVEG